MGKKTVVIHHTVIYKTLILNPIAFAWKSCCFSLRSASFYSSIKIILNNFSNRNIRKKSRTKLKKRKGMKKIKNKKQRYKLYHH